MVNTVNVRTKYHSPLTLADLGRTIPGIMEGEQYIPSIKSRQPGTVKSASPSNATTSDIETSDHKSTVGSADFIGFKLGSQLQKKDTGIHLQP